MATRRKILTDHLAALKEDLVLADGCSKCGEGRVPAGTLLGNGFERYWVDFDYNPRRFIFKYKDPPPSGVQVSLLPSYSGTTIAEIDEAVSQCVILCRKCSDPRNKGRGKKSCPTKSTTPVLPPSSSTTDTDHPQP